MATTPLWVGKENTDVETTEYILQYIRRKNQQYALIVQLLYFYVLAPTCFGSSLPSSGSLLDPPELLENTN
jgi:hypothetical protein